MNIPGAAISREYVDRISTSIRSPFTRFLVFLSNSHSWVHESPARSKWALRIFWVSIAVEVEIHIKGFRHWAESNHWWEAFPLFGYFMDLFLK